MRTTSLALAVALLGAGALLVGSEPRGDQHRVEPELPKHGVAVLFPTRGNQVRGMVEFTETQRGVGIKGMVRGLEPGKHGFHIHEFGDLRSRDGSAAGGHFDPAGHKHGAPGDEEHHYGDLGNITADEQGVANIDMTADWMKLHFIVGRALVVHAGPDDLESQPSGDAGDRVALGVIGIAQSQDAREAAGGERTQRTERARRE